MYATKEEQDDIFVHIILPMILDLIDKWSWFPEITPLKHLHPDQFQQLLDMITLDHIEVKQRLKAADVKVVKDWKAGSTLDYKIFVRRREQKLTYWRNHVKAQMSVKLGEYVGKLDKSKFIMQPAVEEKNDKVQDQRLFVNFN
jgi:hypothetical protein